MLHCRQLRYVNNTQLRYINNIQLTYATLSSFTLCEQ